ncbi:MAG: endonuclease III domain-containing protein [Planctomycetes bacterium]|nr:endonuclease III domain-containing protein [Planctomycetota bacterium]
MPSTAEILKSYYDALYERFGPQHWWPGETPFEVAVGAVLTQNTNWRNVEKAIGNLKREGLLDPVSLHAVPRERLAELIRPAGYYNIKADRLHNLLTVIVNDCAADVDIFLSGAVDELRQRLVSIRGVGLETADSIILYAAGKPTFVVDTYTFRMAVRHGLVFEDASYDDMKSLFENSLPADTQLFNEYHALIVRLGKEFCKKRAVCSGCPLEPFPHTVEETV